LGLLRSEVSDRIDRAPAHGLSGGQQLAAGAFGKPVGACAAEHLVPLAERVARVLASVLAPQPLAMDQMCPGQLNRYSGGLEALNRLQVQVIRGTAVAE
jgi:hypothetical protein